MLEDILSIIFYGKYLKYIKLHYINKYVLS